MTVKDILKQYNTRSNEMINIGTCTIIDTDDKAMYSGDPVTLVIFQNQLRYLNPFNMIASRIRKGMLLRNIKLKERC